MSNPPAILLLEDEAAIADTLQFALQREGMQVQWVSLVSQAEALLAAGGFDLAVFDIGLPDGSGLELLRRLRRSSELPVLLLTARADEVDRIVGLELGADDYVVKPFSPREVAARVKTILKRVRPAAPAAVSAVTGEASTAGARFEHDVAGRRISYQGRRLALTPAEYNVLALLLAQPGRVYSRAQLLDALGEAAEDSFERTIDSHIKTLRAKLREITPAADPIETHRGFGYALSAP
ncbi:two-component system, OmpR family, catabolic regulation response regulator CreB [Andreprevotia lacus DSM 23236]|jgi:two-component system catabolic regulation response regulator CreB|uniref:Two-component system, OmpR family, catabolic regulation response regulator CreB n=1 Tax=Andreprevotia lacus DSM 23236 TaxID=1121001 RepID=A0A1W1XA25_9NEIS|nr:two-component system response regulator CreB [Andreprevotia lacus]SMC20802.1 two-component system, OmpR family, catabolic regulation response regulator CreB [Andreprevotia lacus DSM 23236]